MEHSVGSYGSLSVGTANSLVQSNPNQECLSKSNSSPPSGGRIAKVLTAGGVITLIVLGVNGFAPWSSPTTGYRGTVNDFVTTPTKLSPQPEGDKEPILVSQPGFMGREKDRVESPELFFNATNFYQTRDGKPGMEYPWLSGVILVEPYQDTTLFVNQPVEGMSYNWLIQADEGEDFSVEGSSALVVFKSLEWHTVKVDEVNAHGEIIRSTEQRVICKYVRREIRKLTEKDTQELLDAMKVLWTVTIHEGKKLYGEDYVDIYTINKLHQVAASDQECDHFHEGMGFILTHSVLSLIFEQSLQLVNPKMALHYWDYTIESHRIMTEHKGNFDFFQDVSELFLPEYFGGFNAETAMVEDGRWGYSEIPTVSGFESKTLVTNVYGQLRSPWNINGRPYITRGFGKTCGEPTWDYLETPTCASHYSLQTNFSTFANWDWKAQFGSHGTLHVWIGGIADCSESYDMIQDIVGDEYHVRLRINAFVIRKNMWRTGMWGCSGKADDSMSGLDVIESGLCGCLNLDLDDVSDARSVWTYVTGVVTGLDGITLTDNEVKYLAKVICETPTALGEALQSSATLDPIFWPMHPTVERLFMFKRSTGTLQDMTWPDESGWQPNLDGEETYYTTSMDAESCVGHGGSDIFPFGLEKYLFTPKLHLWGKYGPNTRTNRELIQAFDPRVNALRYVFDNFVWPHCLDEGFDFMKVWDSKS